MKYARATLPRFMMSFEFVFTSKFCFSECVCVGSIYYILANSDLWLENNNWELGIEEMSIPAS